MKIVRSRVAAVVAGAGVLVATGGVGGAVAGNLINSRDIQNGTIRSVDIHDGGVHVNDLSGWLHNHINQRGPRGYHGVRGDKGDPGLSDVQAGADYLTKWTGDSGKSLQTDVAACPDGQYAIGGGYSTWGGDRDLGGTNKDIQITVSAPYFQGDYTPISDTNSNFRPTEWVIKGYNNGTTDQIVRAWVVCANAAK